MLKYRLIFGPIMIVLLLGLIWIDMQIDQWRLPEALQTVFFGSAYPPPGLLLAIVAVLIIPLAVSELALILQANQIPAYRVLISIGCVAIALSLYGLPDSLAAPAGAAIISSILVLGFILTLIWHARHATTQGAMAAAGGTVMAMVYFGIMVGFFLAIRRDHSGWVLLGIIFITKSCDIGAYFSGRAFGKHKLIPWLSPKKTIEGLIGGVIVATLMALLLVYLCNLTEAAVVYRVEGDTLTRQVETYGYGFAIICGITFALVGHAGDLMMSLFKRDAGVKDSGNTLPGFGGFLDVLDSPLLVAPVAYWLLPHVIV